MSARPIDVEWVRKHLAYDAETGELTNLVARGRSPAGKVLGHVNAQGYLIIGANRQQYLAHRVVMTLLYGDISDQEVDHIDGQRANNRLSNIRLVSSQTNSRNKARPSNNSSGRIGVGWNRAISQWYASIKVDGKQSHLGNFVDKEDAVAARRAAELEYGFHPNHGR